MRARSQFWLWLVGPLLLATDQKKLILGAGHGVSVRVAWLVWYQLCEHTSHAIFETKNQNSRMATKTCFGSFLPKHVLVAKSFGHSTISTDSYSSSCQNMFWLPIFFFGSQKWFWQSAANSKMHSDTSWHKGDWLIYLALVKHPIVGQLYLFNLS